MVRIPVEYQEVEYLESTGTQHINTEHLVQSEKIRIVASIIASASYGEQDLIGNQDSATGRFILGFYRYYVFLFARDSQGTEQNVTSETFPNEASNFIIDAVYDLQNETKSLTVNGKTYSGSHERSIISTAKLKLFQNGQNSNKFVGKTRYLRIYEDDNLLFDFIPCYRKSDNEPGMYDTVSGTFFTNAGTGKFLVGNDVSWDTASLLERRRQILLNTPHLTTESANPLTFQTDISANLKDCKIYFEPIQEGSGDPSPDNVRPISGWDGLEIYKSKKNLLVKNEITFTTRYSIGKTGNIASTVYYKISNAIPCGYLAGKTVTLNTLIQSTSINTISVGFYLSDIIDSDNYISGVTRPSSSEDYTTETIPSNAKYMVICLNKNTTLDDKYIVEGTNPLDEVDTPTVITIPFPQTIYGGYVDLARSEVVETWKNYDYPVNPNVFTDLENGYYEVGFGEVNGKGYGSSANSVCSVLTYGYSKTPTIKTGYTLDYVLNSKSNRFHSVIYSETPITKNTARQWFIDNNVQLVREMYTSTTHQLADGLTHITLGQDISPRPNGRSSTGGYANSTATGIDGCKFVYFELGWTTEAFLQYSADISRRSEFVSDSRVLINGTTTDAKLGEMIISTGSSTDYDGDALVYLYVSVPSDCTDLEAKRAYLAKHPVKITYPKKTPIPYTVDLTDLKPIKGTNNIWSNTNSNIEVKFWKH